MMNNMIPFLIQNWIPVLALLIILIVYFVFEIKTRNQGVPEITPQTAVMLANREKAKWVDIRSESLFKKKHIADAIWLDVAKFSEAEKGLKKLQKTPLIIVCDKGYSAQSIGAKLKKLGYNVNSLSGGMQAWEKAHMPVVSE